MDKKTRDNSAMMNAFIGGAFQHFFVVLINPSQKAVTLRLLASLIVRGMVRLSVTSIWGLELLETSQLRVEEVI